MAAVRQIAEPAVADWVDVADRVAVADQIVAFEMAARVGG